MASRPVVAASAHRVAKQLIGPARFREALVGGGIVLVVIGVDRSGYGAPGRLDFLLPGGATHTKNCIGIAHGCYHFLYSAVLPRMPG